MLSGSERLLPGEYDIALPLVARRCLNRHPYTKDPETVASE